MALAGALGGSSGGRTGFGAEGKLMLSRRSISCREGGAAAGGGAAPGAAAAAVGGAVEGPAAADVVCWGSDMGRAVDWRSEASGACSDERGWQVVVGGRTSRRWVVMVGGAGVSCEPGRRPSRRPAVTLPPSRFQPKDPEYSAAAHEDCTARRPSRGMTRSRRAVAGERRGGGSGVVQLAR